MPEKINRVLTDQVSDLLFTSSPEAEENLRREGVSSHRIRFVRNVMIDGSGNGVIPTEPLGHLDFLTLEAHAALVLTDSGGVQEETTYLGVPCLTFRRNTERPVTVTHGTNQLIDAAGGMLLRKGREALAQRGAGTSRRPDLWDGRAAARIAGIPTAGPKASA